MKPDVNMPGFAQRKHVAQLLDCSPQYVSKLIRQKRLQATHDYAGELRVDLESVERYQDSLAAEVDDPRERARIEHSRERAIKARRAQQAEHKRRVAETKAWRHREIELLERIARAVEKR